MVRRLRDRTGRVDRVNRVSKADRAARCNGRSNIERFFQPIQIINNRLI